MGFVAPWFLGALAAVGLPVYIHLLRRHTVTPRLVSSLMFFERGTQSSVRHRRLRYLLLFALRALLLLVLALAFANPFLKRSAAGVNDRLLLVTVDNSFSMRAGTRLADAKRGALDVLATRRPLQRAQVLVLGGQLQLLTQPSEDAAELRAAVESIQPGDAHGNFGELGRGMRALGETVHTPIDLHLFSDMQASNMPANFADMVLPGNVALMLHPVASGTVPNWTVESVQAPSDLVDPKKTRVLAVIAGHGTLAATRTVSLVVNGAVTATRRVDVPADGRATVAFPSLDVPYGRSRCEVRIDSGDAFPADDASLFAVHRADPARVLFVHRAGDTRSPLYFGAALASAAQASFIVQPIAVDQAADVDPTKYAFVVLSDVGTIPSLLENSLRRHVESGGGVLIAAGTADPRGQRIPLFGETVAATHFYAREGGATTISQIDASHPAMKAAAGWSDAKIFYAAGFDPSLSRIVARLADGTPLLLDKQIGQGHVLLFASGFDNVTNDLPLQPAFVPFVDQAARYLSGVERMSGTRVIDSFVPLRNPAGTGPAISVDVVGPDGWRPLSLQEEATAQTLELTRAGFYQVRSSNGRDALLAVNPDRRESALDTLPDETLQLWSGTTTPEAGIPLPVAESRQSASGLWWWVMLVVLLAAVAESIVAGQHLGTQREEA